jgi:hypothetical protein
MARHRRQSPTSTDILRHHSSTNELLLQRANVLHEVVTQGFQSPREDSIVEKETRYILKYSEPFSKAIEVGIDKAQH